MPIPTDTEARQQLFRDAIDAKQLDTVRKLLEADRSLANAPLFAFGQRPISAAHGYLPMIELLLEYGADINLKSDWWAGPWGVLDTASDATAAALIARGATVDIFAAAHLNQIDRLRELLTTDPS